VRPKIAIFILLFFSGTANSQWVSDINTESDWEYYFKNGIIDYNSYQLLREIAEGTDIKDTTDFIISTLGISAVDLIEKLGYSVNQPLQSIGSLSPEPQTSWSGRLRMGSEIREGGNKNYALADFGYGDFNAGIKIREGNGGRETEKRYISLANDDYSLTLGNYTADIGCGLSIGRFDYRPLSLESGQGDLGHFLFPDNSYYNGLKAEILNRYTLIYSVKKYNGFYKNTFGTALEIPFRSIRIGLTGAAAVLSGGSESRTFGAGSIIVESDPAGLKGEIAYGHSGTGVSIQAVRPDLVIKGWYYEKSYLNLQSSGFSHPDYQSYTIDYTDLSFRQSQKGESGFYARKDINYDSIELTNAAEFWKNPRIGRIQYNNSILARYRVSSQLISRMGYTISERNGIRYDRLEMGTGIYNRYKLEARTYINFVQKTVARDNSKFYIMAILPLVKSMSLAGRFRWSFDGLFDYFLEERLLLDGRLFLKATYRWNETLGPDLGVFYIFMENRF